MSWEKGKAAENSFALVHNNDGHDGGNERVESNGNAVMAKESIYYVVKLGFL